MPVAPLPPTTGHLKWMDGISFLIYHVGRLQLLLVGYLVLGRLMMYLQYNILPTWPEQIEDQIRGGGAADANCLRLISGGRSGGVSFNSTGPRVGGRPQLC